MEDNIHCIISESKAKPMLNSSGKITKVLVEVRDCRQYCEEGIYEADACGDAAMLAQFTMLLVRINLMEGISLSTTIPILQVGHHINQWTTAFIALDHKIYHLSYALKLQNVLNILESIPKLSVADQFLYAQALILLADLHMKNSQDPEQVRDMICNPYLYIKAQSSLLSQVGLVFSSPVDV